MPIILNSKNKTLTVKLEGELDLVSAHDFRETVDRAMEEMGNLNLIINMTKVNFIDSSGLGVLLGRFRRVKAKNGQMIVCSLSPNVKRILELSGVVNYITVCFNEAEAWKIIARNTVKEA